jgi:tRNA-dihydrouridine synthase
MVGRASIGYPWIFNEIKDYLRDGSKRPAPDLEERVKVAKAHLEFSLRWKGEKLGIFEMRRHYTNYFRGIPGFKPFRTQLVSSEDPHELMDLLDEIPRAFEPVALV